MAAHQEDSRSLGLSRQEHWSGLPFPSPLHESEKWNWSRSVMSNSSDPMDFSLLGFSVHGIFQARVLEWVAIAFSDKVYSHIYIEFRKMITITLYTRQQKQHRYIRTVFWILWVKMRVGWFERIALKHVYYHIWNRSPVQVRCMRQGAQGWYTGITQRDGMGREVGGGFRMGNTYTPMADSCLCMAKPLHYCKVIKINKLKKNQRSFSQD